MGTSFGLGLMVAMVDGAGSGAGACGNGSGGAGGAGAGGSGAGGATGLREHLWRWWHGRCGPGSAGLTGRFLQSSDPNC
jgi:hypothetical protein